MSRPQKPCGTRAAYRRHLKNNEDPCRECKAANAAYNAEYEKHRPDPRVPQHRCPSCRKKIRSNLTLCIDCQNDIDHGLWFGRWVGRKGIVVWVQDGVA